jgi:hypothetical protein
MFRSVLAVVFGLIALVCIPVGIWMAMHRETLNYRPPATCWSVMDTIGYERVNPVVAANGGMYDGKDVHEYAKAKADCTRYVNSHRWTVLSDLGIGVGALVLTVMVRPRHYA